VHSNATGFLVCCAIPNAKKAAQRSSTIDSVLISSEASKPIINGAFRDPGDITIVFILKFSQFFTTN